MGYWDKKEEKKQSQKEEKVVDEPRKKDNYEESDINHEALENLEKEANESANNILDDIDNLADDIARQKKQFGDLLSTSYWFAVVFNNTDQKHDFLINMGFDPSWTFINGRDFAKRCGVPVKIEDREYSERGKQKAFSDRARPLPEKE